MVALPIPKNPLLKKLYLKKFELSLARSELGDELSDNRRAIELEDASRNSTLCLVDKEEGACK